MQRRRSVSRIFELIVGGLGSLISLFSSSFILLIGNFGFEATSFLGIVAIIGSFLGIFASIHVFKDSDVGGFLFIVSTILVLIGFTSSYGVVGALLLLVAGISALFRK
ncbi:hypothetical protein [uncultured Methanobrevibacter sp.]|uniref:hypothetical protein n=1 Tax=uncultured Methanobrevibacter sp. TaxID=253161 RepID=UPI002638C0D2|nr:hypothetical protein [uncultured Methanobrevibacter sp.]